MEKSEICSSRFALVSKTVFPSGVVSAAAAAVSRCSVQRSVAAVCAKQNAISSPNLCELVSSRISRNLIFKPSLDILFILCRVREETFPSVPSSPHLVPPLLPLIFIYFLLLYILQLTLPSFVHPPLQVSSEFPLPILYVLFVFLMDVGTSVC